MAHVSSLRFITEEHSRRLLEMGLETTDALLKYASDPVGRKDLIRRTGLRDRLILRWINCADLLRIQGLGASMADLLIEADVPTVSELLHTRPENVYEKLVFLNESKPTKISLPPVHQIRDWITQAHHLPPVIRY